MIKKFLLLIFCILSYSYENSKASNTDYTVTIGDSRYPLRVCTV